MTTNQPARRDLHADITNQLIAAIEANPGQPSLPWRRGGSPMSLPTNALTGNAYNGINIISLWCAAHAAGYTAPIWATYKQWAEKGCQVRKGEKSSLVVFYRDFHTKPDPDDENDDGTRRMARASYVFNAAQVEGYTAPVIEDLGPIERRREAERFIARNNPKIGHGGDEAYYDRTHDRIQMPHEGLFADIDGMTRNEGYYATLLHELVHWTGARHRLNREFGKRYGDLAYGAEELVAEIGSAFLCARLGITDTVRPHHAQYLATWLTLFQGDSRAIFSAAARASEAVAFLAGQPSKAAEAA